MTLINLTIIIMNTPYLKTTSDQAPGETHNVDIYKDFEEDRAIGEPHEREDEIIADFLEKLDINYITAKIDGEYYKPYKHASFCRGKKQDGFHVYYAFPEGLGTPVASFWTTYDDERFKFVHINLGKVMDQVIKYYQRRGHMPPPQRDSN